MSRLPARPSSRLLAALLLPVALVAVLAGCSSDASTRAGADETGPTTTAASVTVPETIPAGTTLRVGDQLEYLQTVLGLAGEDQDFPYEVEYSAFIGGPPMLQAFQGGSLDTGFVGSTPLIFAQAADQDLSAVAGWASENGSYGLLTLDPEITGWGDLKGKRVAYQRGTAAEAALLQALDAEGLTAADVTTVDVPLPQAGATLKGGSADAALSVEPLTSVFLQDNPTGKVVARATEITDRSSFVIASSETLADEGKTAALADYTARLVRAFAYASANPDKIADAVYVQTYGLTPERAAEVLEANGPTSFITLPDDIVPQQQKLADLFLAAGQIPAQLDVSSEFDTRFNDLVAEAQGS